MGLEYDLSVWEGYATELALGFGDTPTRVRAVRTAYYQHGFDIDLISQASGFPAWRVRQAILAERPGSERE
ncbi:hypothetical protein HF576_01515 [Microbacterium sp. CFH 90308]|uniref:Uncharacterized protein n=1 Tax=Microbacterium salsuginis TaxID=2722803 RepID=A0ABX1K679_9MICO|nr:hypothetical protein [Microbacterium sp. CFH 90308]NLP82516.1 hypothetical protein [Microbacterium sp. CFH 90308]